MKTLKLIYTALVVVLLASCTDDFLETNTNPNNALDVESAQILTYIEREYAALYGGTGYNGTNIGTYANHIGKIQYVDEARYAYRDGSSEAYWTTMYRNIMLNANLMIEKSDAATAPNMRAVALTLKSMAAQLTTDTWGDVPYSQALQGQTGVLQPVYDDQSAIYTSIAADLATAAGLFDASADAIGGDILYGGSVASWQRLCNSVRLRVAMRMSNVEEATARSVVEGILADQANFPVISANGENAMLTWLTADYRNPWFANSAGGRDDHGIASTIVDNMVANQDPRLKIYAHPFPSSDGDVNNFANYRGVVVGLADADLLNLSEYSRLGAHFRDAADNATYLFRAAEVQFIIAEAANRGWNTGSATAQSAYEAGITASCGEYGLTAAETTAYLAMPNVAFNAGTAATQIGTQKWLSLFMQGIEAWSESRRTDIPVIDDAPGSAYAGHNRAPFRFPLPSKENSLNGAEYQKAITGVVDFFWGKQMWWDTRTGVN